MSGDSMTTATGSSAKGRVVAGVGGRSDPVVGSGAKVGWDAFVADVAVIADVPLADIGADTRLIEDLGCDSLSLVELVVALIEDYGMEGLSQNLGERTWQGVTVGALYDEYCAEDDRSAGTRFDFTADRGPSG